MKKIILLTVALCLCAAAAFAQTGPGFQSKLDGSFSRRWVVIDSTNTDIYTSYQGSGYQIIDYSDPLALSERSAVDVAPPGTACGSLCKVGNLVYSTSRDGTGTYSKTDFQNGFEDGDADLSDGETDSVSGFEDQFRTANWTTGEAHLNGTMTGNESTIVKDGDYSAKASWTANPGANDRASCSIPITGGADNYAVFWVYINSTTPTTLGYARQNLFSHTGSSADYCYRIMHRTDSDGTVKSRFKIDILIDGGTDTSDSSTAYYPLDNWYQLRARYAIHATTGGGTLEIRSSLEEDWTVICTTGMDNDTLTTDYTPDTLTMGIYYQDAEWDAGYICFDDVYYSATAADMDNYQDDGFIGVSDVTDTSSVVFTAPTFDGVGNNANDYGVFVEAKPSGIHASGNYLYVGDQMKGVSIWDISDYADGTIDVGDRIQYLARYNKNEGSNPTLYDIHGLTLSGNYLLATNAVQGVLSLLVSTPEAPVYSGKLDYSSGAEEASWDCVVSGTHLLVSTRVLSPDKEETTVNAGDDSGLWVIDIENLPTLTEVGLFELPEAEKVNHYGSGEPWTAAVQDPCPQQLSVSGNYCYLANGTRGIAVYDISTITSPVYASSFRHSDTWFVTGVDASDIYMSAGTHDVSAGSHEEDVYLYYDWPHAGGGSGGFNLGLGLGL